MSYLKTVIYRYRWPLGIVAGVILTGATLIQTVPFVHMGWASLTGSPDLSLVHEVRSILLEQAEFREMLAAHERKAYRRYEAQGRTAYQDRHLYTTPLGLFGIPGFEDIWAVRVRTDIVDGEAYTSFLVRPGVVIDPDGAAFFSGQCETTTCETIARAGVHAVEFLLKYNLLTSYRLSVTETDVTSQVNFGRDMISTATWAQKTQERHRRGRGRSFAEATP